MFSHFSRLMVACNFAINTQRLTTNITIEIKLHILMNWAHTKFLRLLTQINSLMLPSHFAIMIISIAFTTKVRTFSQTPHFCRLRWGFIAVLAERELGLLFLGSINIEINEINRQNLMILEHHIIMLENLRILLFIVEINRFKSFLAFDRLRKEFRCLIAVWLPDRYFVHDAGHLLLGVLNLAEPNGEYHAYLREFIALLADFLQFVALIQFVGHLEGLEDDAVGVAGEGCTQMGILDSPNILDHNWGGPQCQLQLKLDDFILIWAIHYFRILVQEGFVVVIVLHLCYLVAIK